MTEWMMKSCLPTVLALLLTTAATGPARADETAPPSPTILSPGPGSSPAVFGERGGIVLSTDLPMGGPLFNVVYSSRTMNGGSSNVIQIQPALDFFLSSNLSLGASVGFTRSTSSSDLGTTSFSFTSTLISLGPRIGYNVALAPTASLWIRGVVGYRHVGQSGSTSDQSAYTVSVGADAVVLWHPVPHFFLGGGPAFGTDVLSKASVNGATANGTSDDAPKATTFGFVSIIGGYFGGP